MTSHPRGQSGSAEAVRPYRPLHGLRFLALRFFSVWGPGQRPGLALEAFRRRIEAGQPVIINGDGTQRRDLTHVCIFQRLSYGINRPNLQSVSS